MGFYVNIWFALTRAGYILYTHLVLVIFTYPPYIMYYVFDTISPTVASDTEEAILPDKGTPAIANIVFAGTI